MLRKPPGAVLDLDLFRGERLRPLRRKEVDILAAQGVFEDERGELLRGFLVEDARASPGEAHTITKLGTFLVLAFRDDRAQVQCRLPLAVSDDSEPMPDVAIIPNGDYQHAHPTTAFLVAEVAARSCSKDRVLKAGIYSEAAIPEYWLIDVERTVVVRHVEPKDGAYARVTEHGRGERLALQAFPDVVVPIDAILR